LFFAERYPVKELGLSELTEIEMFYNECYWFLVFAKLYQSRHGYDGGIEQQSFKLMANPPDNVDWDTLADIIKGVDEECLPN
jgi:hypothetical protein